MPTEFTSADLEAYLDEGLPMPLMARVEQALRDNPALVDELAAINARRDAGAHSLGAIWRRQRLSCPTREQLGSYLMGVHADELGQYVRFHLETIGCRRCQANLADLKSRDAEEPAATESRRGRFFQSSAGHLRKT